jgi:tellurite resistance protein TehA-like permease
MRPARVSTIIWGVLLLLVAGTAFAVTALDVELFSGASVAYVVVGLGALLVIAAVVGAIARTVKPAPVEAAAPETAAPEPAPVEPEGQPVD